MGACLDALLNFWNGFQTVVGSVHDLWQSADFELLNHLLHAKDVVWLIVNNEDAPNGRNYSMLDR